MLMAALTVSGWLAVSPHFARGVLIGGLIANLSFLLLKKDLSRVLNGPLNAAKARFFIKYYIRLAVLAVILFFLVRNRSVHIIGLLTGLSTVVLSITIMTAGAVKRLFLTAKEAS